MVHFVKIAFISTLFVNTGNFLTYGIEGIEAIEAFLLEAVGSSGVSNPWAMIDELWATLLEVTSQLFWAIVKSCEDIDIWDITISLIFMQFFYGILILIFFLIICYLTIASFGVLLTTTISLYLVIGFGPLFFSLLFFPVTKHFFDGWLKSCLTYVFTLVIFCAFLMLFSKLIMNLANDFIASDGTITLGDGVWNYAKGFLCLTMVLLAAATMLKSLPSVASSLIGGTSTASTGLGAMMAPFAAGASLAGSTAKNLIAGGSSAKGQQGAKQMLTSALSGFAKGGVAGAMASLATNATASGGSGVNNRVNRGVEAANKNS